MAQIARLERVLEGFEGGLEAHAAFWNWYEEIELLKCGEQ